MSRRHMDASLVHECTEPADKDKQENRDDTLTTNNQTKQRRNCPGRAAGSPSIHRLVMATDRLPIHSTVYRAVEYAKRSIPLALFAQQKPLALACLQHIPDQHVCIGVKTFLSSAGASRLWKLSSICILPFGAAAASTRVSEL